MKVLLQIMSGLCWIHTHDLFIIYFPLTFLQTFFSQFPFNNPYKMIRRIHDHRMNTIRLVKVFIFYYIYFTYSSCPRNTFSVAVSTVFNISVISITLSN